MPFIYKITNDINDKIYVGKTTTTIEQRWKEHQRQYIRSAYEKRPLYNAMIKYGIEHFSIEQIEECSISELNECEKYWIKQYNSYKDGYNATLGGDGTIYANYEEIYNLFQQGLNGYQIHKELGYDFRTIAKALNQYNITTESRQKRENEKRKKAVIQIDKDTGEELNKYSSLCEASNAVGASTDKGTHIGQVCRGKRKTAYGYKWKYAE